MYVPVSYTHLDVYKRQSVDIQVIFYGIGEILIDSIVIVGRWFFGQVISADNLSLIHI